MFGEGSGGARDDSDLKGSSYNGIGLEYDDEIG